MFRIGKRFGMRKAEAVQSLVEGVPVTFEDLKNILADALEINESPTGLVDKVRNSKGDESDLGISLVNLWTEVRVKLGAASVEDKKAVWNSLVDIHVRSYISEMIILSEEFSPISGFAKEYGNAVAAYILSGETTSLPALEKRRRRGKMYSSP